MADFGQLLTRCVNLAKQDKLREALRLTVDAENACESEEDLVELNELRAKIREDLGLVAPSTKEGGE